MVIGSVSFFVVPVCPHPNPLLLMSNTTTKPPTTPGQRIAALHDISRAAGATCLDEAWLGAVHRYRFRCPSGHEWVRRGCNQMTNPRCPVCVHAASKLARRKTDNLQKMHEIALARGGVCLSNTYIGVIDRFAFRCSAGHQWETQAYTVLNGSWCKKCRHESYRHANRLPNGLERLQQLAQKNGGECLSGEYLGLAARYRFRCAEGHEWEKSGTHFKEGSWCAACRENARRRVLEMDAHDIARARGGRCLGDTFVNADTKLRWLCHRGHEWPAPLHRIRKGQWCPECAHMALISNRKSKARRRYEAAGTHGLALGPNVSKGG